MRGMHASFCSHESCHRQTMLAMLELDALLARTWQYAGDRHRSFHASDTLSRDHPALTTSGGDFTMD